MKSEVELIERDEEGYLVDPDLWTKELAEEFSEEENIELNSSHWIVLNFIRDHFNQNQVAPDVRHAFKNLAQELNIDKKAAKKQLFQLFPYGYVKQACKISGMKKPRGWSTG